MALRRLIFAELRGRKVRTGLTVAAVALAVSLVVSVTSGYTTVRAVAERFMVQYMGAVDATIVRENDVLGGVDQRLVDQIAEDPDVEYVTGRLEMTSKLLRSDGQPAAGHAAMVVGIDRPRDRGVEMMRMHAGKWFDAADGNVAVIDQVAAETTLETGLGGTFFIPGVKDRLKLTVVGIAHKPAIMARHIQTVYVPLKTLQRFAMPDDPARVSTILIQLNDGVDARRFADRWIARLGKIDPGLKIRLASDNRREMDRNLQGVQVLTYLGGAVTMLAAAFIILSTLSMGVAERTRTLAMLRAVGAQKRQIGLLVVGEGLALATAGVLIGIPLGWVWMKLLTWRFTDLFDTTGVVLSAGGVLFGSVGSILSALAASFLPAWGAMRVDPLAAMSPLASPTANSMRTPLWCAAGGLLLIAIDPLLMYGPIESLAAALGAADPLATGRDLQFYGHFLLGLPGVMIGFFLLAPLVVWGVERLLGPLVALMFGIRFALLRQQLSTGIWRAAGTSAALMVGLAILVVMQVQGRSALDGWRLPDKFPDIFIWAQKPGGLSPAEQLQVAAIPGIKSDEFLPIAITSADLRIRMLGVVGVAMFPDATMFLGVEPELALKMMQLEFRDEAGRPASPPEQQRLAQQAIAMLKRGRAIIVTDEYRQLRGIKIGDKIPLATRNHGEQDYTVAGVVWSPGIDVMVSMFDMGRQFEQRTATSVFGTMEDARQDFGVESVGLFAANLEPGVDRETLVGRIKTVVGAWGLYAGDVREIKHKIQQGFGRLLLLTSTVAFAAMAVASLGVANTIMASVRTRRWQFGVLRSVGITRGQLLRLVLAEAVLLGAVAIVLGLACGAELAIDAKALSRHIIGYDPPISIPWGIVWIGTGIVMAISLLASLWPAASVARCEPLKLLQAGRAAG